MSDGQASTPVIVSADGGVGHIVLNRPEVKNAIDLATSEAVAKAIDAFDHDDAVAVIVISGAGGVFSAGMDLKAFARGERPSIPGRGLCGLTDHRVDKPVIAAVEGYALAGGCEIALAADIVVAASDASFGLPEPTRGLVAAGGGLIRLAKSLPYGVAMDWALTGAHFSAAAAHHHGLVSRLTAPGQALTEADSVAQVIAANAPLAVRLTKQIVSEAAGWSDSSAYARHREIAEPAFHSEDAREGARSFAEKRPPAWRGR